MFMHTLDYYSAVRSEALILAMVLMEHENKRLSERNQIQKKVQCVIPFI